MRRSLACLVLALLAPAAPAGAAWFPGDTVDGPGPGIRALGDIDLARDGTGGLVYLKDDGGAPHVFLSRHFDGVWRAPERVDVGLATPATQPVIAAADDHRLMIVWASGPRLYGVLAPGGPPLALPAPTELYADPDALAQVEDPHAEMSINGTGYAVFTVPGSGGSDVRAVRIQESAWALVPSPLDVAVDQPAGDGTSRPRVAVSAEGNAVAVWGEGHPDRRRRVYGRRVTGLVPSAFPQEVSLPEVEGVAGGTADSPDIDIEDDGSYAWAVWRQDFGARSRTLARRLVGSLFDPAVAIDAGISVEAPRVSINGRGVGLAASSGRGSNAIVSPILERDVFTQAFRVDLGGNTGPAIPVVAASEREHSVVAWRSIPSTGDAVVRARVRPAGSPFEPEAIVSQPAFGPAASDGLEVAEDRAGNFALVFLQGGEGGRRVVVGLFDRPPGVPVGRSTTNHQRRSRPILRWSAGAELWGGQTFKVVVDGAVVGQTQANALMLPSPVLDGTHRWQVVAVDRRGQETRSRSRPLRIDATPPQVKATLAGKRKRGQLLKLSVDADDVGGSGMRYVQVTFGDGTPPTFLRKVVHRYNHSGRFFLTIKAVDRARNVTRKVMRVRIKK